MFVTMFLFYPYNKSTDQTVDLHSLISAIVILLFMIAVPKLSAVGICFRITCSIYVVLLDNNGQAELFPIK